MPQLEQFTCVIVLLAEDTFVLRYQKETEKKTQ